MADCGSDILSLNECFISYPNFLLTVTLILQSHVLNSLAAKRLKLNSDSVKTYSDSTFDDTQTRIFKLIVKDDGLKLTTGDQD